MHLRSSQASWSGIDLNAGRARLLACSHGRGTWRVERWAERELTPDCLQDGQLRQFDVVSAVLRELVQAAGAGRRIALGLPAELTRHHVLAVPATVRPWAWRSWLRQQVEQLAGAPVEAFAMDVQMLQPSPLTVLLSVCPREVLEDWQGLAEAAGLELALLDDRLRVMHLALQALHLWPETGASGVLAEVSADSCDVHVWRPAQAWQSQVWDGSSVLDLPLPGGSAEGLLVGRADDLRFWAARLAEAAGGVWLPPGLHERLDWSVCAAVPEDADAFLAAFGLALRLGRP